MKYGVPWRRRESCSGVGGQEQGGGPFFPPLYAIPLFASGLDCRDRSPSGCSNFPSARKIPLSRESIRMPSYSGIAARRPS